jgi:thioredoxin 1
MLFVGLAGVPRGSHGSRHHRTPASTKSTARLRRIATVSTGIPAVPLAALRPAVHAPFMATVEITTDNFKDTIEKGGIVLLDFWAEWCGPCRAFAPVFEKASETHSDVVFGKIDTEAQQELAGAAAISAIPTLMLFRDGILLFRESGALPPAALEELVKQARSLDMDKVKKEIAEHQHEHVHGPGCDHDH